MSITAQWVLLAWFVATLAASAASVFPSTSRVGWPVLLACWAVSVVAPPAAILFWSEHLPPPQGGPISTPGMIALSILVAVMFALGGALWVLIVSLFNDSLTPKDEASPSRRPTVVPLPPDDPDQWGVWADRWSATVSGGVEGVDFVYEAAA